MKKQILSIVATLALIIPMSILSFAGISRRLVATVPFDFIVGGKTFKAGKYSVKRVSTIGDETLIIQSEENKDSMNFNVNNIYEDANREAKFVFHRYGNKYFLAQLYDGEGAGDSLMMSKEEREASKKRDVITQNGSAFELVSVLAQ